jgi:hypothetical protein
MSETANETERRKRRSHVPASSVGEHLVIGADGSALKPIQVRTVHSAPWYVRRTSFAKRADQVTVYVLLGAETAGPARFFVVKNSDLASEFRQPPTWKAFGFIDAKSVEKYEGNWEILK